MLIMTGVSVKNYADNYADDYAETKRGLIISLFIQKLLLPLHHTKPKTDETKPANQNQDKRQQSRDALPHHTPPQDEWQ